MSFPDTLRTLRLRNNLTQIQLAKLIGVSKSTIAGYEIGNREPDLFKIRQLAVVLNSTGDELLEISDYQKCIASDEQQLLTAFNKLNPTGRLEAVKRVDELTLVPSYTETKKKENPAV